LASVPPFPCQANSFPFFILSCRPMPMRSEEDFLGKKELPDNVYWGIHTERARHNFPISGYPVSLPLVRALALVKQACCLANTELAYLSKEKAAAILTACSEIAAGRLSEQFPLDALQGGAGTSVNMNINEVIANRALEMLGFPRGAYEHVHPLRDVNMHQSTNDVFPTAIRIAAIYGLRELSEETARLQGVFQGKEREFARIVKIGRTELQEAIPITLGAEFSAFAEAVSRDRWRTFKCEERLRVVNLGGTAVGTGLAAPRDYIFLVIEKLREVTGLGLARGENIMGETANADAFVEVAGILKAQAVSLVKIANDLRLLHFTGEIALPPLQAGSSLMPGKVNPVLMEAAIQTGMKVIANDFIIADAASRGTWQINEFLPLLSFALLESLGLLKRINLLLADHLQTVTANEEVCREYADHSSMLITALLPSLSYAEAAAIVKEFQEGQGLSSRPKLSFREFLAARLGQEFIEEALSPFRLTALGRRPAQGDLKP
jgi:aspartate ammonia-lyase